MPVSPMQPGGRVVPDDSLFARHQGAGRGERSVLSWADDRGRHQRCPTGRHGHVRRHRPSRRRTEPRVSRVRIAGGCRWQLSQGALGLARGLERRLNRNRLRHPGRAVRSRLSPPAAPEQPSSATAFARPFPGTRRPLYRHTSRRRRRRGTSTALRLATNSGEPRPSTPSTGRLGRWGRLTIPDDLAALLDAVFLGSVPGTRRVCTLRNNMGRPAGLTPPHPSRPRTPCSVDRSRG
jgi:hypothetical protein